LTNDMIFDDLDEKMTDFKSFGVHLLLPLILTLFFIQALRVYVPGVYISIFHVVFQDPGWMSSLFILVTIVFFFIPCITNFLCKKFSPKKIALISIIAIVILRVLMAIPLPSLPFDLVAPGFPATFETVLASLIIMFYGFFLGAFLGNGVQTNSSLTGKTQLNFFSIAMIGAFLTDMILRTFGVTLDPTLLTWPLIPSLWFIFQYLGIVIQIPLALVVLFIAWKYLDLSFENQEIPPDDKSTGRSKNLMIVLSLSLAFFLYLETNLLLYPNTIAQYTGTNYAMINPIVIIATAVSLILLLFVSDKIILNKIFIIVINAILLVALVLMLFVGSLLSYGGAIFIAISQVFFFIDFYLVIRFLGTYQFRWNKIKAISNAYALNIGIMILFDFLYDFTTDHAFTISAFRYLGPHLLTIGGIFMVALSILIIYLNKEEKSS